VPRWRIRRIFPAVVHPLVNPFLSPSSGITLAQIVTRAVANILSFRLVFADEANEWEVGAQSINQPLVTRPKFYAFPLK